MCCLVSSGKPALCTEAEVDWNMIDSDHARVKLWLDVRKISKRGPGLFKVNGSLQENPTNLQKANDQIHTMMQQMESTWNPHQKLEYYKVCVRPTMMTLGQIVFASAPLHS